KTSGSAASNMTRSSPSSATIRATTSVRHSRTLGDPFRLDHEHVGAGLEVALGEVKCLSNVARPLGLERLDCGGATGAELDPDYGLRLQAGRAHHLCESYEVVDGESDEAARYFDDVEAELAALFQVARNRVAALGEHVFEKAAGRDLDLVVVAELVEGANHVARHQRER